MVPPIKWPDYNQKLTAGSRLSFLIGATQHHPKPELFVNRLNSKEKRLPVKHRSTACQEPDLHILRHWLRNNLLHVSCQHGETTEI
jgi:hypothetical protein